MDETLKELRLKDGSSFYCPNGHAQKYTNSQSDQLKEAREELVHERTPHRDRIRLAKRFSSTTGFTEPMRQGFYQF